MRDSLLLLGFLLAAAPASVMAANPEDSNAKKDSGYVFTPVIELGNTAVKDQNRSGTCWSFSTISFLESEMLRQGKDTVDLSEMFVVNKCYAAKGDLAVRMHGKVNFGAGGAAYDVVWAMENFGLMPEEAYAGLEYGAKKHDHSELDNVLEAFISAVVKGKTLTTAWKDAYDGIIDTYLGKVPEKFTYKGKEYTPRSFADEYVGLKADDYVSLTSFTHHPFYTKFILEVPDNWLYERNYNVTLDELVAVADEALKNGYTFVWGADVSERGFSHTKGIAVVPETEPDLMDGTERSRWEKLDRGERARYGLDAPVKEKEITQEIRQKAFDNYETTDDHGMHIVGTAKDQNGTEYYIVKNSWDTDNIYKGYFYASKNYFKYKTMNILVHKDAIPKDLKKKLGIK